MEDNSISEKREDLTLDPTVGGTQGRIFIRHKERGHDGTDYYLERFAMKLSSNGTDWHASGRGKGWSGRPDYDVGFNMDIKYNQATNQLWWQIGDYVWAPPPNSPHFDIQVGSNPYRLRVEVLWNVLAHPVNNMNLMKGSLLLIQN